MFSKCIDSGYLVGATLLTVFHRLFWNTADVFGMEWRCVCGFGIMLRFCFSLFLLCALSLFLHEIYAIKVYRLWMPCGRNSSYSFPPIVLKLCRCFLHGMKTCMWFWYNHLIFLFFSISPIFSYYSGAIVRSSDSSSFQTGLQSQFKSLFCNLHEVSYKIWKDKPISKGGHFWSLIDVVLYFFHLLFIISFYFLSYH